MDLKHIGDPQPTVGKTVVIAIGVSHPKEPPQAGAALLTAVDNDSILKSVRPASPGSGVRCFQPIIRRPEYSFALPAERVVLMSEIVWLAMAVLGGSLMLPVLSKLLSNNNRMFRRVKILAFVLYVLIILYETLLFRDTLHDTRFRLSPLWSYRASLSLYRDGQGFGLFIKNGNLLRQILLNILLFVPFGCLLPFAFPKLAQTKRPPSRARIIGKLKAFPWIAVLIGTAFSMAIEFTQLFFQIGLFELDDIFNNTIGCFLGVLLYQALIRKRVKMTE